MSIHWLRESDNTGVGHDGDKIYIFTGISQWTDREVFEKKLDEELAFARENALIDFDYLTSLDKLQDEINTEEQG